MNKVEVEFKNAWSPRGVEFRRVDRPVFNRGRVRVDNYPYLSLWAVGGVVSVSAFMAWLYSQRTKETNVDLFVDILTKEMEPVVEEDKVDDSNPQVEVNEVVEAPPRKRYIAAMDPNKRHFAKRLYDPLETRFMRRVRRLYDYDAYDDVILWLREYQEYLDGIRPRDQLYPAPNVRGLDYNALYNHYRNYPNDAEAIRSFIRRQVASWQAAQ